MLKFNCGDKVKVNIKLNVNWDNIEKEIQLTNQTGIITEALENAAFPYQIKFDNEVIQSINMAMGSRLFDEYELDFE